MTTNELRKELIVKHLKNNAYNLADEILGTSRDWSDSYVERIKTFNFKSLQSKVLGILFKHEYPNSENIVYAFSNFIVEESECAEQIFFMGTDLKEIWFDMLGDGFLSQLGKLETAIENGDFHTTDLYWEMPSDKPIHSFNELRESKNFEEHAQEFANSIIADDKNDLGIPDDVFKEIREYLKTQGI